MVRGLGRQRPQRLLRIWVSLVIFDTALIENYNLSSNCLKQALGLKECFPDYSLLNVLPVGSQSQAVRESFLCSM